MVVEELGMMSLPGRRATNQKGEPIMMSQRFKRLSHSLYECKYHIVFCPKYCYRIFKDAIGEYAKQHSNANILNHLFTTVDCLPD